MMKRLSTALGLCFALMCFGCNDPSAHTDGFGDSWSDTQLTGTHNVEEAQAACEMYRKTFALQFAGVDGGIEDQTPDYAVHFLCEVQNDGDLTVSVCTDLDLKEAPSLSTLHRHVCWLTDQSNDPGGITVNGTTVSNRWD